MSGAPDDERILTEIRDILTGAVDRLATGGARDEALAEYVGAHRTFVIRKNAVLVPVTRVWRLGVLLLDKTGTLYETGSITRAVEPGWSNFQSVSAESRREYRAAALRGRFRAGETVNYDASVIDLTPAGLRESRGALFLRADRPMVRWNTTASDDTAVTLDAYLADRIDLLIHPPEGA